MTIFGIDQTSYPGDARMDWLFQKGLRVTGFYLGPTAGGEHPDAGWMGKRATLATAGWGFLPVYVGRQAGSADLGQIAGAGDGHDAARLMTGAGFPPGSVLYLDIEAGPPAGGILPAAFRAYIEGWVAQIRQSGFSPGVYCTHSLQATVGAGLARVWTWHVPVGTMGQTYDPAALPAGAADPGAVATQYRQNVFLTGYGRTKVDLSLCTLPDPSGPPTP